MIIKMIPESIHHKKTDRFVRHKSPTHTHHVRQTTDKTLLHAYDAFTVLVLVSVEASDQVLREPSHVALCSRDLLVNCTSHNTITHAYAWAHMHKSRMAPETSRLSIQTTTYSYIYLAYMHACKSPLSLWSRAA